MTLKDWLDEAQDRYDSFIGPQEKEESHADLPRALSALRAVLDLCETSDAATNEYIPGDALLATSDVRRVFEEALKPALETK